MDYKKIIKSRKLRFKLLKFFSFIPDRWMLRLQYKIKMGFFPNFSDPKRFTEKLQLYKMYYRDSKLPVCVDKLEVRNFVKSKGLEEILNELYGVYSKGEEIEFDKLPEQFVIKTNDGGGGDNIIICRDKHSLDMESTIKTLNSWLNKKDINAAREWAYTGIKESKIIVEKYLEELTHSEQGLRDYKFFCFDGEPYCVVYDWDRYTDHKRNFYDLNWNNLHITSDHRTVDEDIPKPNNFGRMVEIARKLSAGFPFVRVDLYSIGNKIYFGELTFYPWSGYVKYNPEKFDFELGSRFDISRVINLRQ